MTTGHAMGLVVFAMLVGCADDHDKACDTSQHACTYVGMPGIDGFNGDGKDRRATELYWAMDMKFASDGTPWLIDWNDYLVRKVVPDDTVHTVVGWTGPIFPGDGDPSAPTLETTPGGAPGTDVQLNHPTDLAFMPDGTLLIAAWHNHKIRKIDPATGNVTIVSGKGNGFAGDGGPASMALFNRPNALRVDDQGQIYILDQANLRIRMIDTTDTITTIAGNGTKGFAGDGGPATMAELAFDTGENPEPSGGLALANGTLYIADTQNNRIRALDLATHVITTIAGTGDAGFGGDGGPALAAQLSGPRGPEIGPDGRLYVADTDNHRIRAIDLVAGTITTVAGTGMPGLDADDDHVALDTALTRPFGVSFDAAGNLYIADTINSRYVRVAK